MSASIDEKKKRVRSTNFTYNEKEVLLNIIYKYKNIIENKKTDSVSCEEKSRAWEKITGEFHTRAPNCCKRSIDSLKKFYDNQKKEIRKIVAEEKKEIVLTGGGSLPKQKRDSIIDLGETVLALQDLHAVGIQSF